MNSEIKEIYSIFKKNFLFFNNIIFRTTGIILFLIATTFLIDVIFVAIIAKISEFVDTDSAAVKILLIVLLTVVIILISSVVFSIKFSLEDYKESKRKTLKDNTDEFYEVESATESRYIKGFKKGLEKGLKTPFSDKK